MKKMGYLGFRFHIAVKCLGIIRADKSILFFPFASMVFACTILSFFYFTVGPDKLQLMLNTLRNEQGVQTINAGYYGSLAVAFFLIVTLATAMNFALAACIRIRLDGEDSKVWDGIAVVLRRLPAILAWSVISITLGALWTLLDQERRSSSYLRRKFGNTWQNMSMLTVPIAVFENRNIFSALLRSRTLVNDTWGRNVSARFGFVWFVVILSLPLLFKFIILQVSGVGITLPFAEIALLYFACALILAGTAKSILKVVLYRFAAEGTISEGFDREALEGAFLKKELT